VSAAGIAGGKLPAALRALFASLLRRQPGEPAGASPAPAAPDGTPPGEGGPAQRLLAGPGGAQGGGTAPPRPAAGKQQQAGFFEAPGPRPGSRALFLKDFIARFHEVVRRGGVTARDPLHPVLTMLGEMLVHFTHLQSDHAGISERASDIAAARLREEGARMQATIAGEGRGMAQAVSHGAARIEAAAAEVRRAREDVQRGFREDTEALLRKVVVKQVRARTWRDRLVTATVLAVAAAALVGGGIWYGRSMEREDMALATQAMKIPLITAALRDGKEVGAHWLGFMEWNHLDQTAKTCTPQPSGPGYRLACTITFWAAPPLDPPPPRLP